MGLGFRGFGFRVKGKLRRHFLGQLMLVLLENCFEFLERSGLTHTHTETDTQTEIDKTGSLMRLG